MSRPWSDMDTPLPTLRQQIADIAARQREDAADQAAQRLRDFLAPTTDHAKEAS